MGKTKQIRNREHLQFVASHFCCLSKYSSEWCRGSVQAHHLLKPYDGIRGMGMRAGDNNCVPLCQYHHALLHNRYGNEDEFWKAFGLTEDFGRINAKILWDNFMNGAV